MIKNFLAAIAAFLGPAAKSVVGHINAAELFNTIVLAFSATGAVGVVQVFLAHANTILVMPQEAQVATLVLTFLLEILRRKGQGSQAIPWR